MVFALLALVSVINSLSNIYMALKERWTGYTDPWSLIRLRIMPWLYVAVNVANFIAGYCYLKFFRVLHLSINNHDAVQFNRAFRYIYRNAVIFIVILIIDLVVDLMYLFPLAKYL
jgi:hypothetical protein